MAKFLGYKMSRFSVSPYGCSISYFGQNINFKDEIKIAIAGPFVNLLTAFLMVGVWWIFPSVHFFTESFVSTSLVLGLFNLLPAYPLDGGRIFVNLTSQFISRKTAKNITLAINLVLCALFFCLFCVFCFVNFNPSFFLMAMFMLGGVLDLNFSTKYEKINIFNKKIKNFVKPTFVCISPEVTIGEILKKIQSSKTYVFCLVLPNGKIVNLSEKMIVNLSLLHPYNCKLSELIA